MLDQNTDRMYWMIGAVIIVGLLIVAAKVAFPDLFDKVIDEFLSMLTSGLQSGFINFSKFWG